MSDRIHYASCPVCQHSHFKPVFDVIDQLVSRESFTLMECESCHCRFTQDPPDLVNATRYYQSSDYISHTNTRRGLINQIYQLVRRRTLVDKVRLVEKSTGLKGGRILDVGSGTGAFVAALRRAGWRADGIEPDSTARHTGLKEFGISLMEADQLFKLPAGEFDAITLWHVLEHVHDLEGYMQQFQRLLKPGGSLLLALPNYTSWDAKQFGNWWAAYDVPRHLYHFSPDSIRVLSKQNRFDLDAIRPMWYDAFYIALLSHQHKTGSSRWLSSLWVGLRSNWLALTNKERASSLIYQLKSR